VIVTALHTKKGRGQLRSAHGPNLSYNRALWADLPKKAEKAKKSEKAAQVVIPVHDMPLDETL
jgi:hypothetical protein